MCNENQSNNDNLDEKKKPGPNTAEGIAKCSMNALKHGLTGATIFLPSDNVDDFKKLEAFIISKFNPETETEKLVVYDIAVTEWRLQCIPQRESALFVKGRFLSADKYPGADPDIRMLLIDTDTETLYSRDFINLTLQQTRLKRHLERRTAEFKELREEREVVQTVQREIAMRSIKHASIRMHETVGSEFSVAYLLARAEFTEVDPKANVVIFDRTWRDKSANKPN